MTPRPITPEDLWGLRRVGRPSVARSGGFAVVPVTGYDVEENVGRTRLYRVSRDGTATPLTAVDTDSTDPAVSPDGTRVAFLRKADKDAKPQIHVMSLAGGESERFTDLPLGALGPRWTPDGAALVFPAAVLAEHEDVEATRAEVRERAERKVKARTTEDRVYRYWNRWTTEGEVHHLFRLDLESRDLTDLLPGWIRPIDFESVEAAFDVAPVGTEIAFHALAVDPPYDEIAFAVYVVNEEGEPTALWPDGPPMQRRPRYSPDGRSIAFGYAVEYPGFYADRIRLTLHDRATGEHTVLTEHWDRSCTAWEWTPDGGALVFVAEDDARQNLFRIRAEGGDPEVVAEGGWIGSPTPTAEGEVWCLQNSLSEPDDVAVASGGELERITAFNAELLSGIEMGRVEDVRFRGADGDEIQMFVVFPPGFDARRRWPLVHDIHGGPHGVSGDFWHYRWNPQVFAAPGYVVATVNFHGSSSWGNDFARSIHGAWGDMPAADVEAATDHLLDTGWIDADRIAITGGSYGGYLVSWIIGRTGRYAAAICHAGVTNLLGQWATDVTHGRHVSFGGDPWHAEGLENIRRWSPTDHLAGATTPTLVIHGEADYRVVVTQGLELYGILKGMGVEARLVYYPDEGHWILTPQNSLHWHGEFLGWLDRHLGG